MRRPFLLLLLVPLLAGCGRVAASLPPAHAASPQSAALGWVESVGDRSGRVVFGVRSFGVTKGGWRADVSLKNDTGVALGLGKADVPGSLAFGLMLFSTGTHSELEERNPRSL